MGLFLIILLVVFILWPWISPRLSRWFQGFMSRRAEDMMRRMMGMPSRKEERRQARRAGAGSGFGRGRSGSGAETGRRHRPPTADAAAILKSVAEDVEFTEIREFDSATIVDEQRGQRRVYREEQVTDAEFTEIKDN